MRKTIIIPAVVLTLLAFGGCSAGAPTPTKSVAAVATPTATPTPTPTVMNNADAGAKYLAVVCPSNNASAAFTAAWQTQDLATIQAAAATARDATRESAVQMIDPTIAWPDNVKADLKIMSDADFGAVSVYDEVSKATSVESAGTMTFGDQTAAAAASQRVRAVLGLTADTSTGC